MSQNGYEDTILIWRRKQRNLHVHYQQYSSYDDTPNIEAKLLKIKIHF